MKPDLNTQQITDDAIFRVGKVISVEGRLVKVKVDKEKNASHLMYRGELLKNISVGGYIKIIKGFTTIIGKVEGETINEEKQLDKKKTTYKNQKQKINRVLSVSLLGFFKGKRFERGIKELPLIDNECFLLHVAEFNQVHNFLKQNDLPLTLGALSFEKGQEISVGINSLFASHVGIFGNTGSGKSYTLAKIYFELFKQYKDKEKFKKNAKFFLIDFNGEYTDSDSETDDIIVEGKYKKTYKLSTLDNSGDKFPLTKDAIADPEFWVIFLQATEKTQTPFLRRAIQNTFFASRLRDPAELKVLLKMIVLAAINAGDKNTEKSIVTNFLSEINGCLESEGISGLVSDYRQRLGYHTGTVNKFYYQTATARIYSDQPEFRNHIDQKIDALDLNAVSISDIDQIRLQIIFQYYDDIIKGFSNKEHLAPLIKRMDKRIDDIEKVINVVSDEEPEPNTNFFIVSLKDVNLEIRKTIPLLLCKKLYLDKKSFGDEDSYLNIIIDEAHNVLSEDSEREAEQWKDYRLETFEEIIKEGRKFGVFLTLASQRPSDISETIISQLHNYFLHRLINNEDIRAVEKTISYLDKVSFEYLPILPTGTCIMAGLLASVPVVLDIGKISPVSHEPRNKTITLLDKWN